MEVAKFLKWMETVSPNLHITTNSPHCSFINFQYFFTILFLNCRYVLSNVRCVGLGEGGRMEVTQFLRWMETVAPNLRITTKSPHCSFINFQYFFTNLFLNCNYVITDVRFVGLG